MGKWLLGQARGVEERQGEVSLQIHLDTQALIPLQPKALGSQALMYLLFHLVRAQALSTHALIPL